MRGRAIYSRMSNMEQSRSNLTRDEVISVMHQARLPITEELIAEWLQSFGSWSSYRWLVRHQVSYPLAERLKKNVRRRGRDIIVTNHSAASSHDEEEED